MLDRKMSVRMGLRQVMAAGGLIRCSQQRFPAVELLCTLSSAMGVFDKCYFGCEVAVSRVCGTFVYAPWLLNFK